MNHVPTRSKHLVIRTRLIIVNNTLLTGKLKKFQVMSMFLTINYLLQIHSRLQNRKL